MIKIKDYFLSLDKNKKIVFLFTVVAFLVSGGFFAVGANQYLNSNSLGPKGITSPISDYFGRANKAKTGQNSPAETAAKTVPSPLNGVLYTPEQAADWQARRPMAVMVNNHVLARPQTGLSQADIIYEAVAEGGITRLLAVFQSKIPEKVGPVRSARKYYVDFAKENDAWYAHWGGASTNNEANVYDYMRGIYVNSVDAMWAGADAFWRDFSRDVPTEHTGFTSIPKLYDTAYARYPDQVKSWRGGVVSWAFKDETVQADRPSSQSVSFNFWDLPDFVVKWDYDPSTNSYKRSQGGKPFVDTDSGETLAAKNVVILFMEERSLNDGHGHLIYKTTGQGAGKAFVDGVQTSIKWVRPSVNERTRFLVSNGLTVKNAAETDLQLNRGQIWIEILSIGSALTVN